MNVAEHHDRTDEGESTWLWPLYALLALIASILNQITKLKRVRPTTKFKPNWRDSWQDLRRCEWLRDQVIAHGLECLLAGKDLDLNATLFMDPPADYGGRCPHTPFDMNQRFLALARWAANPEAIIRERFRRLAKRAGIDTTNPLASHGSTDAALRTAAHHEAVGVAASSHAAGCVALMVSSAQSARPSTWRAEAQRRRDHEGVLANARGPPAFPNLRYQPAPNSAHPATETAPAFPLRQLTPSPDRRKTPAT